MIPGSFVYSINVTLSIAYAFELLIYKSLYKSFKYGVRYFLMNSGSTASSKSST